MTESHTRSLGPGIFIQESRPAITYEERKHFLRAQRWRRIALALAVVLVCVLVALVHLS